MGLTQTQNTITDSFVPSPAITPTMTSSSSTKAFTGPPGNFLRKLQDDAAATSPKPVDTSKLSINVSNASKTTKPTLSAPKAADASTKPTSVAPASKTTAAAASEPVLMRTKRPAPTATTTSKTTAPTSLKAPAVKKQKVSTPTAAPATATPTVAPVVVASPLDESVKTTLVAMHQSIKGLSDFLQANDIKSNSMILEMIRGFVSQQEIVKTIVQESNEKQFKLHEALMKSHEDFLAKQLAIHHAEANKTSSALQRVEQASKEGVEKITKSFNDAMDAIEDLQKANTATEEAEVAAEEENDDKEIIVDDDDEEQA